MHRIFDGSEAVKELAAVLAVVDFKRPNLTRKPSLAYLAFLAGLEETEFDAALRRLESKGFLQISGTQDRMDISLTGLLETIERETK